MSTKVIALCRHHESKQQLSPFVNLRKWVEGKSDNVPSMMIVWKYINLAIDQSFHEDSKHYSERQEYLQRIKTLFDKMPALFLKLQNGPALFSQKQKTIVHTLQNELLNIIHNPRSSDEQALAIETLTALYKGVSKDKECSELMTQPMQKTLLKNAVNEMISFHNHRLKLHRVEMTSIELLDTGIFTRYIDSIKYMALSSHNQSDLRGKVKSEIGSMINRFRYLIDEAIDTPRGNIKDLGKSLRILSHAVLAYSEMIEREQGDITESLSDIFHNVENLKSVVRYHPDLQTTLTSIQGSLLRASHNTGDSDMHESIMESIIVNELLWTISTSKDETRSKHAIKEILSINSIKEVIDAILSKTNRNNFKSALALLKELFPDNERLLVLTPLFDTLYQGGHVENEEAVVSDQVNEILTNLRQDKSMLTDKERFQAESAITVMFLEMMKLTQEGQKKRDLAIRALLETHPQTILNDWLIQHVLFEQTDPNLQVFLLERLLSLPAGRLNHFGIGRQLMLFQQQVLEHHRDQSIDRNYVEALSGLMLNTQIKIAEHLGRSAVKNLFINLSKTLGMNVFVEVRNWYETYNSQYAECLTTYDLPQKVAFKFIFKYLPHYEKDFSREKGSPQLSRIYIDLIRYGARHINGDKLSVVGKYIAKLFAKVEDPNFNEKMIQYIRNKVLNETDRQDSAVVRFVLEIIKKRLESNDSGILWSFVENLVADKDVHGFEGEVMRLLGEMRNNQIQMNNDINLIHNDTTAIRDDVSDIRQSMIRVSELEDMRNYIDKSLEAASANDVAWMAELKQLIHSSLAQQQELSDSSKKLINCVKIDSKLKFGIFEVDVNDLKDYILQELKGSRFDPARLTAWMKNNQYINEKLKVFNSFKNNLLGKEVPFQEVSVTPVDGYEVQYELPFNGLIPQI